MSTKNAAFLGITVALATFAARPALATGSTCSTTCTPGAVQCDGTGSVETCVLQSSTGDANCPSAAELVYVVDEDNMFSSFTPGANPTFNDIGTLNCNDQNGGTPFSMSIDRTGTAWVLYSDGTIFEVNTTTLACTQSSYNANNTGYTNFGMGFVAQTAGGTTDNLFIANVSPLELGILNTSSLGVSTVGNLSGSPELTGTGSALLYGFFPDANNPRVSLLNQTTGAESSPMPMTALAGNPEAWAFAFYGGDFWVFLMRESDNSTNVWHLDGSTGAVTEALSDTGRTIVGAGESTCVPVSTCYDWQVTACPANEACTNGACVATCTDACTAGATQCDSSGDLDTCATQSSGCTGWNAAPCASGLICSNGACIPNCANRCIPLTTQCSSTGEVQTCSLQSDGCFDWDSTACPANETCSGGTCVSTCTNQCTAGAVQCASTNATETCATQSNGCTDWNSTPCPGAEACMGGACCTCTPGATQCSASGELEVCTANPATDTCPTWITTPCNDGTCIDGACFTSCNPNSELSSCPAPSTCTAIPAGSTTDYCATAETDGGYLSPTPNPSTTTSSGNPTGGSTGTTGTNPSGTAGTSGGTGATTVGTGTTTVGSGGTHGASTGTSGGTMGGSGHTGASGTSSGSNGSHGTSGGIGGIGGTAGGSSGGAHTSGAAGSSGSNGTAGGPNGNVATAGCGCQSGGDASMLGFALLGLGSAGRRRRATRR